MKVLIRYLRRGPDGISEAQDFEVQTRAVTIGSAADRTIQLLGRSVGAQHATIAAIGSKLKLSCARGRRFQLNGKEVRSAALNVGDEILIAGHRLNLINPPAGFDLGIEVQLNAAADASEFETAFRTDLDQTWLSKRGGAWMLAVLTAALALLLPLRTAILHREGAHVPGGLPDEALWSAGPLIPPHELALGGSNCGACHQEFFVRVQDGACRQCHQPIQDHVAKQDLVLAHLGAPQRCAQCHAEHDGDAALSAIRHDGLCLACHAQSKSVFGSLKVQTVSGFASAGAHPAFSVTLQTGREPLAAAQEHSNLKFSHAQHLDASRVSRAGDGGALGCSDCHTLERSGEHFQPITMARDCASCHQLTFDPANPSRELPHGKPLEAMYVIEDYFARRYSGDPKLPPAHPAAAVLRRLPDRDAAAAPLDSCTGAAYLCANRRAAAEIENQFAGRGCVSCHTVTEDAAAKDIHGRFEVLPVRLNYEYFSGARFNHRQHAIQKNLLGDEACASCHNARSSTHSTDVMIPDVDRCLQCHTQRHEKDKVTTQCVSCHTYHPGASPGALP
jgi:hypothetical protein